MSKGSSGKDRVVNILMKRDSMSREEASSLVDDVMEMVYDAVANGDDAEEIWMSELGLEPDYLMDLLI